MKIAVILPAAGAGKRFVESSRGGVGGGGGAGDAALKAATSKLELDLCGKPVFLRALEIFFGRKDVGQIILAVNPDAVDEFKFKWGDKLGFHGVTVVAGGRAERWETVQCALASVADDATHVAVHDAARPLATAALVDRVFEAAAKFDAVAPGLPVSNTLKRVVQNEAPTEAADPLDAVLGSAGKPTLKTWRVVETVDRAALFEVQTPQVFELTLLRRAYAQIAGGANTETAKLPGAQLPGAQLPGGVTDDAGLVEALGERVTIVEGESSNVKITRPQDMELALALVEKRQQSQAADLAKKRLFADDED